MSRIVQLLASVVIAETIKAVVNYYERKAQWDAYRSPGYSKPNQK